MANTIKTLSAGDITRKALSILHNQLVFVKTINRQYDDRFARSGAKNGGSLEIRLPNEFTVRTGATMDTQDVTELTKTFTVATQKGVDINFSSVELTLSMDDFSERILTPAMARLAADVEDTILVSGTTTQNPAYSDVWNISAPTSMATTPASLSAVLQAGVKLTQGIAPDDGNRHLLYDPLSTAATLTALSSVYHAGSAIEQAVNKGLMMNNIGGFKMWQSNIVPTHTNGTRTDTTPITASLAGVANGDTTLTTTGFTSGHTLTVGDVFTVDGIYAVNQETKSPYSHLQQFTVRTAKTLDSTDVIDIYPTIYKSGPRQNVYHATWTGTPALNNLDTGGSGAASGAYVQNMAYHKDAFTFVTADLEQPKGVDFAAREVYDGISLSVVRQFDIVNRKFPLRMDVLFGAKTVRPEWATRVRGV